MENEMIPFKKIVFNSKDFKQYKRGSSEYKNSELRTYILVFVDSYRFHVHDTVKKSGLYSNDSPIPVKNGVIDIMNEITGVSKAYKDGKSSEEITENLADVLVRTMDFIGSWNIELTLSRVPDSIKEYIADIRNADFSNMIFDLMFFCVNINTTRTVLKRKKPSGGTILNFLNMLYLCFFWLEMQSDHGTRDEMIEKFHKIAIRKIQNL